MENNELRIGNWLLDIEPYNKPFQVRPINIDKAGDGWVYKGIPLTPEILEKCGFKKHPFGLTCFAHPDCYPLYFEFDLTPVIEIGGGGCLNPPCKFLHQLQNLYFALTGQELEIKL